MNILQFLKALGVCFSLSFIFCMQLASAQDIEHFLMPADGEIAQKSIIKAIEDSKTSIDVAMFMFTNKKIANALIEKSKKSKENMIRVIVDKSFNNKVNPTGSKYRNLTKAKNIRTFLAQGLPKKNKKSGIMHAKLLIIDDETVYLGSTNFTNSAFSSNFEILIRIKDKTTAKLYKLYFNQIVADAESLEEF